jgi:hypothetical protein
VAEWGDPRGVPVFTLHADALGIDRFFASGASGGGPHALAVAAWLDDRVLAAECLVSSAPSDAADLDFLAGMDPENRRDSAGHWKESRHCTAS